MVRMASYTPVYSGTFVCGSKPPAYFSVSAFGLRPPKQKTKGTISYSVYGQRPAWVDLPVKSLMAVYKHAQEESCMLLPTPWKQIKQTARVILFLLEIYACDKLISVVQKMFPDYFKYYADFFHFGFLDHAYELFYALRHVGTFNPEVIYNFSVQGLLDIFPFSSQVLVSMLPLDVESLEDYAELPFSFILEVYKSLYPDSELFWLGG